MKKKISAIFLMVAVVLLSTFISFTEVRELSASSTDPDSEGLTVQRDTDGKVTYLKFDKFVDNEDFLHYFVARAPSNNSGSVATYQYDYTDETAKRGQNNAVVDTEDNSLIIKSSTNAAVEYVFMDKGFDSGAGYNLDNYQISMELEEITATNVKIGGRAKTTDSWDGLTKQGNYIRIDNSAESPSTYLVNRYSVSGNATRTVMPNTTTYCSKTESGAQVSFNLKVINNSVFYSYIPEKTGSNGKTEQSGFTDNLQNVNGTFAIYVASQSGESRQIKIKSLELKRLDIPFDGEATGLYGSVVTEPVEPTKLLGEDILYKFDNPTSSANQELIEALVPAFSSGEEGAISLDEESGALRIRNSSTTQYKASTYWFATEGLADYTIMIDAEIEYGAILLSARGKAGALYTNSGNILQVDKSAGASIAAVTQRINSGYQKFEQVNFGSLKLKIMLNVEGGKFTAHIGHIETPVANRQEGVYDTRLDGVAGDFAISAMNLQDGNSASIIINKLAYYEGVSKEVNPAIEWPNSEFPLEYKTREGIDDMLVSFDGSDTAAAQAFLDGLNQINRTTEAVAELNSDGEFVLKNLGFGQHKTSEFFFGARALGDFTVMMEIELVEGQFNVGARAERFNPTHSNGYYAKFEMTDYGAGAQLDVVKRFTNYGFKKYSGEVLGSVHFSFIMRVEGGRFSIICGDGVEYFNKIDGVIDELYTEGGDLVFSLVNVKDDDLSQVKIKKFAFYNGITALQNVMHNYGEGYTDEQLAQAGQKLSWPNDEFYVLLPSQIGINLIKQYTNTTPFKVGDTISINISEYFEATVDFSELTISEMRGQGTFNNNTWTYTFTEAKSYYFTILVAYGMGEPTVLSFRVDAEEPKEDGGGCGGCGYTDSSPFNILFMLVGGFGCLVVSSVIKRKKAQASCVKGA